MVRAKQLSSRRRRSSARSRRAFRLHPAALITASILIAALILGVRFIYLQGNSSGFAQGVWVNGTHLGGYSYEDGKKLIEDQIYQNLHVSSYQITYEDQEWTFTAGMLGATLDATEQIDLAWNFGHYGSWSQRRDQMQSLKSSPIHLSAEMQYDEATLDAFIESIRAEIDQAVVNSTAIPDANAKFEITPSSDGRKLDTAALKEILVAAIVEGEDPIIDLNQRGLVTIVKPTATEQTHAENIKLISEASTSYKGSKENRIKNIKRALQSIDGLILQPGDTIYFNSVTGKRTKANGYYEADEYVDGKVVAGIGGGTCQVSTTLYQALLKADVFIEQRSNHGMTVSYTKPSLDAAVWEGQKDLVFTNLKTTPIYIYTEVSNNRAIVRIYGQPLTHTVEGQDVPCEIKLESVVTETFTSSKREVKVDTTGKHAKYTDEYVLAKKGKDGVKSYGVKVYYDLEGREIDRVNLANDLYMAQSSNYWVGVINPETGLSEYTGNE